MRGYYDVSPDGKHLVLTEPLESAASGPRAIHVVQNWYQEFRDREQD